MPLEKSVPNGRLVGESRGPHQDTVSSSQPMSSRLEKKVASNRERRAENGERKKGTRNIQKPDQTSLGRPRFAAGRSERVITR